MLRNVSAIRDKRRNRRPVLGVECLETIAAPSAAFVGSLAWTYDEVTRVLTVTGTDQNDTIILSSDGAGNFTLSDGVNSEVIVSGATGPYDNIVHAFLQGLDGNDHINTEGVVDFVGNLTLDGGEGNDRLDASDLGDSMVGGGGNDTMFGGTGDDTVLGGDGDDVLRGREGDDLIRGGNGDDNINGNDGNDNINGNSGDDVINGGAGDDAINGGAGTDAVDGGFGTDTAVNAETVTDVP